MRSAIEKLIDESAKCCKCSKKKSEGCDCWIDCKCGWLYEKNKKCDNPKCKNKEKK
jgi:hypothetical protein